MGSPDCTRLQRHVHACVEQLGQATLGERAQLLQRMNLRQRLAEPVQRVGERLAASRGFALLAQALVQTADHAGDDDHAHEGEHAACIRPTQLE